MKTRPREPPLLLGILVGFLQGSRRRNAGAGETNELKGAPDLVLAKVDGSGTRLARGAEGQSGAGRSLGHLVRVPASRSFPTSRPFRTSSAADDFLMLGVVLESGEPAEIQAFVAEKEIRYPQVLGEEGTKESFGPFLGYPTKYLIDRDGRVVKRYFGMVGDELASDVETLIQTGSIEATTAS